MPAHCRTAPSAWPPMMDLEGFSYDRLGGLGGDGGNDMRQSLA